MSVSSYYVQYDFVSSDHKPLITVFTDLFSTSVPTAASSINDAIVSTDWSQADDLCISQYRYELDIALRNINIPDHLCTHSMIYNSESIIYTCSDSYYDAIISCVQNACVQTIPFKIHNSQPTEHTIPGWNDYVKDKHDTARATFLDWMYCGKSRTGPTYDLMRKSRSQFKLALRYCQQYSDMLRADAHANALTLKAY